MVILYDSKTFLISGKRVNNGYNMVTGYKIYTYVILFVQDAGVRWETTWRQSHLFNSHEDNKNIFNTQLHLLC